MNCSHAPSVEITTLTATELAARIADGGFSSSEVVDAHIRRIEAVNPRLNAVVVPLFDQARAEADAADRARRTGRQLGPLHGVPITVKEMFDVAGTPTTAGLTKRTQELATCDAPLVARLRRAGAIVLGKTNVPLLGMGFDSENPLYGRTRNPWNLDRAPGGSSGGEAAIVAAGGSPLGLGSDGGGSIRQPCHSCGICGLKPTGRRLTLRGHWMVPNWSVELAQAGPLARNVADLEMALRVLNSAEGGSLDLATPPVELRRSADVSLEGLRIGVYVDDGCFRPAPAVRRAVHEAAAVLRARGADVDEFVPPNVEDIWRVFFGLFYADQAHFLKQELSGSPPSGRIGRQLVWYSRIPTPVRPPLELLMRLLGQRWFARTFQWVRRRELPTRRYLQLLDEQERIRRRFADAFDAARLNAIVCPPSPVPAFPHGTEYATLTASYTLLYNVLGMPAGVVPATRVRPGEESDRPSSRDAVEREAIRDEQGTAGLPVGVQVVARHWREDVALAVMRSLEAHFRAQPGYPDRPPV
jgi:fatty acid amide hydrolase